MWTRSFIVSTTFALPDLDAVSKRLLRNPADFAAVLRPFYGDAVAAKFESLFSEHLLIAAQLVNAAKAGNMKVVDEQREKWYLNAMDIADFLSAINPCWNKKIWQEMLFEHLDMTEHEAVQMLSGQYTESIIQYDAIQNEALLMGDEMARGIFCQFGI